MTSISALQNNNFFAKIGGDQDTTKVDAKRVDKNVGAYAEAVVNIRNEVAAALNPKTRNPNETFLKDPANERLAHQAITVLNQAYRALIGKSPAVVDPTTGAGAGDGHVSVMLYGVFLFNRIQEALTQIGQEIAQIQKAMTQDAKGLEKGLQKLLTAQAELQKIHQVFLDNPALQKA
jgi:hypothetical protein